MSGWQIRGCSSPDPPPEIVGEDVDEIRKARSGENVELRLQITNHSPRRETYRVRWNLPPGWKTVEADREVAIPARRAGSARAVFKTNGSGLQIVTADVIFGGRELKEWAEALVRL